MQRLLATLQAARGINTPTIISYLLPAVAQGLPIAAQAQSPVPSGTCCSVAAAACQTQHSPAANAFTSHQRYCSHADVASDPAQQQQQQQQKRHTLKCKTSAAGTAVSQAIACMVDRDVMPRQQLCDKMEQLSQQLAQEVANCSSTELSAFVEACRKMEFQHRHAFKSIIQHLAPAAADIAADELPSILWAASTLASDAPPSSSSSSSSSSSGSKLPQNDGVIGAVNSSKVAGQPEVVEFMLGASTVLSGDMCELDSQELPIIAAALSDLEYRDPFLLTVLAETVLERKQELSEGELVSLLHSFAAMGRWFFDNRVLDQLTAVLVDRARAGKAAQGSIDSVAACLGGINHRSKALLGYLEERGGSSSSS